MKSEIDYISEKNTESCMPDGSPVIQGDATESIGSLYDSYVQVLFNFGCKITSDRELVKDCIHDVFVKIYYKQEEMGHVQHVKSYLFVALKNKLCDELRKNNYYTDNDVEDYQLAGGQNVEDDFIHCEKEALCSRSLKRLMNRLSVRERQAITLYYLENRRYEEISLLMGINYQSLRNLICRGLARLRSISLEKSLQIQ